MVRQMSSDPRLRGDKLQCFEERLDHGVVMAVAFAGHRDLDAALGEFGLVIARAILATLVGMVDQTGLRLPHGEGFAECFESQLLVQAIADGPPDDAGCANRSMTTARYSHPSRVQT